MMVNYGTPPLIYYYHHHHHHHHYYYAVNMRVYCVLTFILNHE